MAGVALLVGGIILVVAGAELFFDGLVAAAGRLGVSAYGLTVVVSGFELENLAAGIAANAKNLPGAAAGTFLGGTTFLALGVAGLAALIAPLPARLPARAFVWTALAPVPLLALGLDGRLSRLDGALLLAWSALALFVLSRGGLAEPATERRRWGLIRLVGGLAILTAGGELLGEGIRRVVQSFGVSQTLLGNTAVAASVEAEEVARVAVPGRRGRPELALANVVGTIVHFVAFNAGVIALVRPLPLDADTRHLHLPAAVAATAAVVAVAGTRGRIGRPEGAVLLSAYAGYLAASVSLALA